MADDNQYSLPNPYETGQVARYAPTYQMQAAASQANPPGMNVPPQQPNVQMPMDLSGQPPQQPYNFAPQPPANFDNVLNDSKRQERLGKAFDLAMDVIDKGESKPNKLMSIIGAFGDSRPHSLIGGLAHAVTADRQVKEQQTQNAYNNLIKIANVVGATHIKPLANMVKENRLEEEQLRRQAKDAFLKDYNNRKLDITKKHFDQLDTHASKLEELKKYGIDTRSFNASEQRKLQTQFHNQTDERVRDLADLNAYLQTHKGDQQVAMAMANLKQTMQRDQASREADINKYNSSIATRLLERDKDGNFKYRDEQGKPLDPKQYMLNFAGFNNVVPNLPENEDVHAQDLINKYTQSKPIKTPESTPKPQMEESPAAQQVAQKPAGGGISLDAIQQRVKQSGASKFQALSRFVEQAKGKGYSEDEAMELAKKAGF